MTLERGGTVDQPTMTQQVAVLADPHDEHGLVDAWRDLAELAGNGFVTPEWYATYERHYGAEAPPFVVRVRDADGTLAGVLPLCRDADGRRSGAELDPIGGGRGPLRFAGANLGDRFTPVAVPGREAEVARLAAGVLGRAGLVLHNVDEGAPWVAALANGLPRRAGATRLRGSPMPYVELAGHTWDSFLGERSRNFRSQVRRKERTLLEKHGARVRTTARPEEVAADVAAFYRLHAARWADREGGSTITKPTVHAFLTDFAGAALERGWLRLSLLEVPDPAGDGFTAVAALFAWRIGGRYAYYQAGFDPDWAPTSVGLVLMAHTVRAAIEEGAAEYDLLLGDEEYKFRFATGERAVETLVVAGPWDRARLMAGLETQVRRVTDSLSPELRSKLRDAAGPVLSRMPGTRKR